MRGRDRAGSPRTPAPAAGGSTQSAGRPTWTFRISRNYWLTVGSSYQTAAGYGTDFTVDRLERYR